MTAKELKKQKQKEQLHILMVSLVITLAVLFVIIGIGVVAIRGGQSVSMSNLPAAVTEQDEFLYEVSFMGQSSLLDFAPLNHAAGFLHRNSFLIPPPLRFARQTASCVYLAATDSQRLRELMWQGVL